MYDMVRLEMLIFPNGERYPILVDTKLNIPLYYPTLWTTVILRSSSSVNTIRSKLYAIRWLLEWERTNNRNIVDEFKDGKLLSQKDMIGIKEHLRLSTEKSSRRSDITSINPTVVSLSHQYNRMTSVIEYLEFVSSIFLSKKVCTVEDIAKMFTLFKSLRPKGRNVYAANAFENINIPDGLLDEFVDIAYYKNPRNPFKNKSIRKRNYLMFLMLRKLGIRRGELLSIRINDLDLTGSKPFVFIRRTHDDPIDTRAKQAVAKTKERRLVISFELAGVIDDYILNHRNKIPNANKHPYLFVTHRKGTSQGNPLSISAFDNIIIPAMKKVDKRFSIIHPHIFRHEWNLDFSIKVDMNNKLAKENVEGYSVITQENEAKYRQHWMGHTSEKSSHIYNKRHVIEQANKLVLIEQHELANAVADNKKEDENDE